MKDKPISSLPPEHFHERRSLSRGAHSLSTASLSSHSLHSNTWVRRDSTSSQLYVPNKSLGHIEEDSTDSFSMSFERPADHTFNMHSLRSGHYVSKSLNNVADFYDDSSYNSNQIQNELVKILQHKLNKAQSRLQELDKKKNMFEMKRLKETDDRRAAEQTLRKLELDRENLEQLNLYRRGSDEDMRNNVSVADIDQVYSNLMTYQRDHERIQLQLSEKQEQIPKIKAEIDSLDNENKLLRQLCQILEKEYDTSIT